MKIPTLQERMDQAIPHDDRTLDLYGYISDLDFEECGDSFCFKTGGDGDNGEILMYLMDCYFAEKDMG